MVQLRGFSLETKPQTIYLMCAQPMPKFPSPRAGGSHGLLYGSSPLPRLISLDRCCSSTRSIMPMLAMFRGTARRGDAHSEFVDDGAPMPNEPELHRCKYCIDVKDTEPQRSQFGGEADQCGNKLRKGFSGFSNSHPDSLVIRDCSVDIRGIRNPECRASAR
jgi:hypothetical protein